MVNETFPDICPWPEDHRQGMDVYVTGAFRSRGERGGDGYRHVGVDTAAAAVVAGPADARRCPPSAGSLLRFCELIGTRSITEFNYRYTDDADAHIFS